MKKIIWLIILSWLGFSLSFAQIPARLISNDGVLEELINHLETTRDTNRIDALLKLSEAYKHINPLQALDFAQRAYLLSRELKSQRGSLMALNTLGVIYNLQGRYQKALSLHLRCARFATAINDKKSLLTILQSTGLAYETHQNQTQALTYYLKALELAQESDNQVGIAKTFNLIGNLYREQGKEDLALSYHQKALDIFYYLKDSSQISVSKHYIGHLQLKKPQEAIETYLQAIEMAEKIKDKEKIANFSNSLARVYQNQNDLQKATFYAQKSLDIAQRYFWKTEIQTSAWILSELNAQQRNFEEAHRYYQIYANIKDSLFLEREKYRIAELKESFEEEKRKNELQLLSKDKIIAKDEQQIKDTTRNYLILMLVLGAIASLVLLRSNFRRKATIKRLQSLANEVRRKNQEIELQKASLAEVNQQLEDNNGRLNDSIRYAEKIQRAILPYERHLKEFFADYFVIFKPRDIVSGDFYWFCQTEGKIFLAMVDCTGHGVPGAFMSMMGYSLLNEIVMQEKFLQPSEILQQLHHRVRWALKQKESQNSDGMDIALCCLEKQKDGRVLGQFSGAKNNLHYFSKGQLNEIKGDRKGIGGWQKDTDFTFENFHFELQKGDTLYLATDGYVDASDDNRKKLGVRKYRNLLEAHAHSSMKEQGAYLLSNLYQHQQHTPQRDDITLLGVRI
jgi:serine phosphatase RsbU (regulator of sigma subunit)